MVFKADYCLMQNKSIAECSPFIANIRSKVLQNVPHLLLTEVKSIAECSKEHSAILSTFSKLQFVIMIFVLSVFEWPLKTGFTVPKSHQLAKK